MPLPHDPERERRLDEVLAAYLRAAREGTAPDRAELLATHPDLAEFFADQDAFRRLATPLRRAVAGPDPPPLRAAGEHDLLGEIARGGMGVVFRARHRKLGRVVALKMLLAGRLASPAERERFRVEAHAAASLEHPHIVPIYEVGEHDGYPYLSMRLLEGGTLAQAVARGDWPARDRGSARRATELLRVVARTVHFAHQRGLLHRDLKPANVLLDAEGRPHVSDFGLAKFVDRDTPGAERTAPGGLTQTGAVLGTPGYMAPEQAAGARAAVTTATDVWGLGAILYELLTGRPPFRADSPLQTLALVLERDPVRPRALNPRVEADLETICLKCLEKDPARRYASAQDLADDLGRFLAGEPIRARPAGALTRAARWARRQPLVAGLALALGLAVGGGLAAVLYQWRRAEAGLAEAREALARAERLQTQADASASEARAQGARARAHARVADESFRNAHRAVNDLCLSLNEKLEDMPGSQALRKQLLRTALGYYRNFVRQRGHDPALRRELADTYVRMAQLSRSLGAKSEAFGAYSEALALYRGLHRDHPDNVVFQHKLCGTLDNLSTLQDVKTGQETAREARALYEKFLRARPAEPLLRSGLAHLLGNMAVRHARTGEFDRAWACYGRALEEQDRLVRAYPGHEPFREEMAANVRNMGVLASRYAGGEARALCCYRKALDLAETLARARPRDPRRQADVASCQHSLGIALRDLGQRDSAREAFEQALHTRARLAAENPLVARHQVEWSISLRELGIWHSRAGRKEKALDCYEQARRVQERVVRLDPGARAPRKTLAESYFDVAVIHGALKRRDQEGEALAQARRLQEELAREEPDDLEIRADLGRTLNNLGINLWVRKRPGEARAVLHRAIDNARLLMDRAPQVPAYRRLLNAHYGVLAEVEWRMGHHARSVEVTLLRQQLWPDDPRELYNSARELADASRAVGKGSAALTPEEEQARRRYLGLVMSALRRAVDRGFRDARRMRDDPSLRPVRGREDFQALLRELEKKSAAGPQPGRAGVVQ
jgi:eukaryotic-like serine/threonine-protein kinase